MPSMELSPHLKKELFLLKGQPLSHPEGNLAYLCKCEMDDVIILNILLLWDCGSRKWLSTMQMDCSLRQPIKFRRLRIEARV